MRSAFKRIFRRKTDKKKKGRGFREPTDDSSPDEVGNSKPVSLFQPKQQGRIETTPVSSSIGSGSASKLANSGRLTEQNISKSTSASSIIAPIREEFDKVSVTSANLSPVSSREVKSVSQSNPPETMRPPAENKVDEAPTDGPTIANNYAAIPVLEQTKLPRGGVSVETKAVGRVQVCFVTIISVDFPAKLSAHIFALSHSMESLRKRSKTV